jgi:RNA polymerase sigma factor (sigma-70 family)
LDVDDTTEQTRFAEVFLPHLVDAFRLAHWLAGSRADAEDIVQEASMRAFRGISSFAGGNPRAWVLTIVRNTSYSWLAKNRPSAIVLLGDLDDAARQQELDQADPDPSPEAQLIAKTDSEAIRRAMAMLPAPFREVLVLREIHDLNYKTIAEIAGLPIGTVMSRLARARRLLLASLEGRAA